MVLVRNPRNGENATTIAPVPPCKHRFWTQWSKTKSLHALFEKLPRPPVRHEGRHPLAKLRWSGENGCVACKTILEVLDGCDASWMAAGGDGPAFDVQIISISWKLPRQGNDHAIALRLWRGDQHHLLWLLRKPNESPLYPPLATSVSPSWPLASLRCSLDVVAHTGSQAAASRISTWLAKCVADCAGCGPDDWTWTPRRLIRIGSFDDETADVRLYEPNSPTTYACLGDVQVEEEDGLRTKISNLADHMNGMAMMYLPTAVRDAVTLCRRLRIPALWVASLCTITDYEPDLASDMGIMMETYANSHLTVFANTPSSRLFGPQAFGDASWQRELDVEIHPDLGKPNDSLILRYDNCGDFQQRQDEHFHDDDDGSEEDGSEEDGSEEDMNDYLHREDPSYLELEAYQASKRRLIFNGKEMSWFCNGRSLCECGHKVHQFPESRDVSKKPDAGTDQNAVATQPSLVAVGDLAWSVKGPAQRQTNFQAPTWSPASIDGSTQYNYKAAVADWRSYDMHMEPRSTLVAAGNDGDEENPPPSSPTAPSLATPPATAGSCTLRGPLAEVELVLLTESSALGCRAPPPPPSSLRSNPSSPRSVALVRDRHGNVCPVRIDVDSEASFVPQTRQAVDCGGSDVVDDARRPLGFRVGVAPEPLYCLHLLAWEDRNLRVRDGWLCRPRTQDWFLLLRRARTDGGVGEGADAARYERVGIGFWDRHQRFDYPYWVAAWLRDSETCALLDGAEESTVTLV